MTAFDLAKWMDEDLDPAKVRREESFTSDNHRAMMLDHEFRKERNKASINSLEYQLADLMAWWETHDTPKPKKQVDVSEVTGGLKPRKEPVFTQRQLEIAGAVATKRAAHGKG
jgi:hypothetical protein